MVMKSEHEVTNCHILLLINQVNFISATRTGDHDRPVQPEYHSDLTPVPCPAIPSKPALENSTRAHKLLGLGQSLAHRAEKKQISCQHFGGGGNIVDLTYNSGFLAS